MENLLPFLLAGAPGAELDGLPSLLESLLEQGITTLELGLPHSDPVADGPILQEAAQRALEARATPRRVLEALAQAGPSPDLVLFTYFNPVFQLGEELLDLLRPTPVKALLVVDLPPGEEPRWEADLRAAGYPLVPLLSPTTSVERAGRILEARPDPGAGHPFAQRFAYVVARLGVTGAGQALDLAPLQARLEALGSLGERPLAVGFGLDEPSCLQRVRAMGATPVIGSALVGALQRGERPRDFLAPRLGEAVSG